MLNLCVGPSAGLGVSKRRRTIKTMADGSVSVQK